MARRKRRSFGFTMKIPKAAYQKALKKVQQETRSYRGRRSKSSSAKRYATNRDRSVVYMYRFQNRKKHGPWSGYLTGYKVTDFTGLRICTVTKRSSGRSGFVDVTGHRSTRVTVIAKCIDGRKYVGRGPGDGMYLRLTPKRGR